MLSQTTSTHSFSWSDWGLLVCSLCFMFVSSPCVLPAFSPYLSLSPPHLLGCVVQSVSWAGAWCIYSREERLMGFSSSSNAGCFWVCVEWIQRNSMGSCSGPLWWMDVLLVSLCSPLWECCSVCESSLSCLFPSHSLCLCMPNQVNTACICTDYTCMCEPSLHCSIHSYCGSSRVCALNVTEFVCMCWLKPTLVF